MSEKTISVAKDYSTHPYGRYKSQSKTSAEGFRDDVLLPALKANDRVIVILDGARGYGSSFLEETFGGLVRIHAYTKDDLIRRINFVSNNDPTLIQEINQYIEEAK